MSRPQLPVLFKGTETSSLATPLAAWELMISAERAVWVNSNYSLAICYLRRLLACAEYVSTSDHLRKRVARKIWNCITDDLAETCVNFLSGKPRARIKGQRPGGSRRELLRESLRQEHRNVRHRGLSTRMIQAIDQDIAEFGVRMYEMGQLDRDMYFILKKSAPALTDETLRLVQERLLLIAR